MAASIPDILTRNLRPDALPAVLLAGAPAPFVLLGWWHGARVGELPLWALLAAIASTLAFVAAAALLARRSPASRLAGLLGSVGLLVVAGPALAASPALALSLVIFCGLLARTLWRNTGAGPEAVAALAPAAPAPAGPAPAWVAPPPPAAPVGVASSAPGRSERAAVRARGASLAAVSVWVLSSLVGSVDPDDRYALTALALSVGGAIGAILWWGGRALVEHPQRVTAVLGVGAVAGALAGAAWGDWSACIGLAASVPIAALVIVPGGGDASETGWLDPILAHPARLLVATFLVLSILGAILLGLPVSSATGEPVGIIDAGFTSVSAVCVTGLIVKDTPVDFSGFGLGTLLVLIQLGGLGIMTFSTAAMRLLGRRMSMRHEGVVARIVSPQDRSQLFGAARRLLVFTFVCEVLGAAALTLAFSAAGEPVLDALWRGVFTAISAFCNAGFALQSDSLIPYQGDPLILHTIAALIIAGGLSPAVALVTPAILARSARPIPAQAKLVLAATAALLVVGFLGYLATEWDNSLAGMTPADRLHNAWFQSVTLRTAGFNSVDIAAVRPATLTMMMLWMFVGGSPGGTAGGVKTTTASLLLLAVVAAVRGRRQVVVFGKSVAHRSIYRAAAAATIAALIALVALVALQLTQTMSSRDAAFEVVSAVGTVGLSVGGTGQLDGIGKGVIIVCMFVGRVGTLTLFMLLAQHRERREAWRCPDEEIDAA
jgi:trk system potassium uptake protein TrkH